MPSGLTEETEFGEEPDLLELIYGAIRSDRSELNTCMPGYIVSYNKEAQTCTVRPVFQRIVAARLVDNPQENGIPAMPATIDDVPVVFPRSGEYGLTFPIKYGDTVMILFSQRSLDEWLPTGGGRAAGDDAGGGGTVRIRDYRLHNRTDAIVVPGLFPETKRLSPAPVEGTQLRGAKMYLGDPSANPDPVAEVGNREVIEIVDKLIEYIMKAKYPVATGGIAGPILPTDPEALVLQALRDELQELMVT